MTQTNRVLEVISIAKRKTVCNDGNKNNHFWLRSIFLWVFANKGHMCVFLFCWAAWVVSPNNEYQQPCLTDELLSSFNHAKHLCSLTIFWMTNVETTPLRLGGIPMYSTNIGRRESSNNNFWLKLFGSSYGYIPISHKSLINKFQSKSSIMKCWQIVPPSWIIHCISFLPKATTGWLWCCTDLGFGPALGTCGSWYFVDLIPLVVCDLWEDLVGRNMTF